MIQRLVPSYESEGSKLDSKSSSYLYNLFYSVCHSPGLMILDLHTTSCWFPWHIQVEILEIPLHMF